MSRKLFFLISLLLVVSAVNISMASPGNGFEWNNGIGSRLWTDAANWTNGTAAPGPSDSPTLGTQVTGNDPYGPIIQAGMNLTTGDMHHNNWNVGFCTLTMTGGSLDTANIYYLGGGGTLDMQGGTIVSGQMSLVVEENYSTRPTVLNMSGGMIQITGLLEVAHDYDSSGSSIVATINLSGGEILAGNLVMNANGLIDISGSGKLIISGDVVSALNGYVSNGWITAYGGTGTVVVDYGVTTPGKTTVTADCDTCGDCGLGVAANPAPANNAEDVDRNTALEWTAGPCAASHNVYLGTDFNQVKDANTSSSVFKGNQTAASYLFAGGLDPGQTYYWRIDEVNDPNLWAGEVWKFTVDDSAATEPFPADRAIRVDPNTYLSWTAGAYANSHNVYSGIDFNDVNDANTLSSEYKGNQANTVYTPSGSLEQGRTHFWRIDEITAFGIIKGSVWEFTTAGPNDSLWSWIDKIIPDYGQEPIRPGKNVRLGIVSWMYYFDGVELAPPERAQYVGPRFDMFFHDTIYWTPESIQTIRSINPAVCAFSMAWPTLCNERPEMLFGAVGGFDPATMSDWVLRTSDGVEVPSQLWDFGDTHYMDIGNLNWADHFRSRIMAELALFGSDGIVLDGTPMDGIYYLNIPGYSPLANYTTPTQVNDAIFQFMARITDPHDFILMDDRPAPYWANHYDALWGEDWFSYDSSLPWGSSVNWDLSVSYLETFSAAKRPYICQAWYHYGNRYELKFMVASYLLAKNSNSATFQPCPIGHPLAPSVPSEAPYDYSSYWVEVYEAELQAYPEIFDIELGDTLGSRYSVNTDLWARDFEHGKIYVNSSTSQTRVINLAEAMYDVDNNEITEVTLSPKTAAMLRKIPHPADLTKNYWIDFADYARFSLQWLNTNCAGPDFCDGADFEPDGDVDFDDLDFLLNVWLTGG